MTVIICSERGRAEYPICIFSLLQKISVYNLSIFYFRIDEGGPIFLMCLGLIFSNYLSLTISLVWRLENKSEILFLFVSSVLLFLLML